MGCSSCLKYFAQGGDFRSGLLMLGFLSPALNLLGLFLLFVLGLRLLQFTWHGLVQFLCDVRAKSSHPRNMFCTKSDIGEAFDSKVTFCKCGSLKLSEDSKLRHNDNPLLDKEDANPYGDVPADDYEGEFFIEDEEFDVIALRRLVKVERLRANMASAELEKERMAAASAADEAMGLILRLRSEMSSMEIEANQYRRLTEKRQEYDGRVIQSLEWIAMKHEYERVILEEKLRLYKQKLKQYMTSDEVDQFEAFDATLSLEDSTVEDGVEDVLND